MTLSPLEPLCFNRPCRVIGPGGWPHHVGPDDLIIGVGEVVPRLVAAGCAPDVAVISSHLLAPQRPGSDAYGTLEAEVAWVLGADASTDDVLVALPRVGSIRWVYSAERDSVLRDALGGIQPVATSPVLWAACLALVSGADGGDQPAVRISTAGIPAPCDATVARQLVEWGRLDVPESWTPFIDRQ